MNKNELEKINLENGKRIKAFIDTEEGRELFDEDGLYSIYPHLVPTKIVSIPEIYLKDSNKVTDEDFNYYCEEVFGAFDGGYHFDYVN